jgi:hypothetical protein
MKKIFSAAVEISILVVLLASGCEKKEKELKSLLVGQWNLVTETYSEYKNNQKTYEGTDSYAPGETIIEINDNSTGNIFEDGELSDTFTWSLEKGYLIMNLNLQGRMVVEFTVNDSTLTMKITTTGTNEGDTYKTISAMLLTRA